MKKIYLALILLAALFATSPLTGCTSDEEIEEVSIESVPYYIPSFVSNAFPKEQIIRIEKARKEELPYTAYLTNNIDIQFTEEGYWKQINIGEGAPDNLLSTSILADYSGILEKHFNDKKVTTIQTTSYGERLTLNDGKQLAFYTYQTAFKGYESPKKEELPQEIQTFILTHFPDNTFKYMIINLPDWTSDDSFMYDIWLENDIHLIFDTINSWTKIDCGDQLIPNSILETLPENFKEALENNYPDAEPTWVTRYNTEYTIEIHEHQMYAMDVNPVTTIPGDEIQKFITRYFGDYSSLSLLHTKYSPIPLTAITEQGFNILMTMEVEWKEINGFGRPFPQTVYSLLPKKLTSYIATQYPDASITKATQNDGYHIMLTDGKGLIFDNEGNFKETETIILTAYDKAYGYMRLHYPEDCTTGFTYSDYYGWTFKTEDGIEVHFDKNGELINKN